MKGDKLDILKDERGILQNIKRQKGKNYKYRVTKGEKLEILRIERGRFTNIE